VPETAVATDMAAVIVIPSICTAPLQHNRPRLFGRALRFILELLHLFDKPLHLLDFGELAPDDDDGPLGLAATDRYFLTLQALH